MPPCRDRRLGIFLISTEVSPVTIYIITTSQLSSYLLLQWPFCQLAEFQKYLKETVGIRKSICQYPIIYGTIFWINIIRNEITISADCLQKHHDVDLQEHSLEITEIYSHTYFDENFVKSTFSLNSFSTVDFTKCKSGERVNFSFYHNVVKRNKKNCSKLFFFIFSAV